MSIYIKDNTKNIVFKQRVCFSKTIEFENGNNRLTIPRIVWATILKRGISYCGKYQNSSKEEFEWFNIK